MKFYVFILILAMFSWSCSSKDEESSDSTVASVCSETSSNSEVYEIFQLGTTNCNLFCDGKSLSECHTSWGNGSKNLNYQYVAKSWTPLNTVHNESEVYLYNFTPIDYENVSISDNNGAFKSSIQIKAWNRIKYQHVVSGDNVTVTIPSSNNPIMLKFANIQTKWKWAPHNYDPDGTHDNWWTNWTGAALRANYIMNYNMANFLSTDTFKNVIVNDNITYSDATTTWYDSSWGTYDNNSVIVSRMRDVGALFKIGVVHGGTPSGLGGGDVHGVAPHVLYDHMRSSVWSNKGWNGADIWFHEFAHCLGFSHSSNMTYPQAAPYDSDISGKVQTAMVNAYKQDNTDPLFPPGDGQEGIDCNNELAGLSCPSSRSLFTPQRKWNLADDQIFDFSESTKYPKD